MPLVEPIPADLNADVEELAKFFNETLGFCPNSILTMQIRPEIACAFINLNKAVMTNTGRVTSPLKRLIGYIASENATCLYCQAHTIRAAERYGAADEQMKHILEYKTHPAFDDSERAALNFAKAASSIPNGVNEQIKQDLKKHWNDGEIVEILAVISLFGYLNRWNDSMGTTLETQAIDSGNKYLKNTTCWNVGKHV
ncbi:unnamed protein product [Didymodactylos carnosus]|uniref:Carboxymuconolactone decarboxylase-like domain-containing protein n=1 Tax=Didymodactylos carnosus TaxID=1234261 RepID=A0A815RN70_9BILA|nr:unnamed protein product [Didymodactylos carnosus]CAF1477305.1 unnamed protein product [Didymodactylos carnosus]CAF4152043.1 unnamed protein product [Didymodactylos carnosus]CAF4343187.1 unnamed protein product [Didymodactylos carnosus]